MNIFEAIRKDHDKQRELCRLVTSTTGCNWRIEGVFALVR